MKTESIIVRLQDAITKISYTANGSPIGKLTSAVKDWESAKLLSDQKMWFVDTDLKTFKEQFHVGFFRKEKLNWEFTEEPCRQLEFCRLYIVFDRNVIAIVDSKKEAIAIADKVRGRSVCRTERCDWNWQSQLKEGDKLSSRYRNYLENGSEYTSGQSIF